jgi:hypothetical protein
MFKNIIIPVKNLSRFKINPNVILTNISTRYDDRTKNIFQIPGYKFSTKSESNCNVYSSNVEKIIKDEIGKIDTTKNYYEKTCEKTCKKMCEQKINLSDQINLIIPNDKLLDEKIKNIVSEELKKINEKNNSIPEEPTILAKSLIVLSIVGSGYIFINALGTVGFILWSVVYICIFLV